MFQVSQGTSKAGSISPPPTRSSPSLPPSAAGQALGGTYNRGFEAREALAMQWQGSVSRICQPGSEIGPLPAPPPPPSSAGPGADLGDSRTTALPPTPPSASSAMEDQVC